MKKQKLYIKLVLQHLNRNALSGLAPAEQLAQAEAWAVPIAAAFVPFEAAAHRLHMQESLPGSSLTEAELHTDGPVARAWCGCELWCDGRGNLEVEHAGCNVGTGVRA